MKQLLALLMMIAAPVLLHAQVKNLTPEQAAAELKKKNVVLLDVRTDREYTEGHLRNTLHADVLMEEKFLEQIQQLDKSKTYIVYCRSGKRSHTATEIMQKHGFARVFNMEGGILAWKGEIVKPE